VVISDSVISIEDGAFHDCYKLKSIEIPDSVSDIHDCAFASTRLEHVIAPERNVSFIISLAE